MRLRNVLIAAALILAAFAARPFAQVAAAGSFVPGEILVKFAPGGDANARAGVHLQVGGIVVNEIQRTRVQRISVRPGDEAAAIAWYRRHPNVQYAEPNFIRTIPALGAHSSGSEIVPQDYYFGEQWALHNTGQMFMCIIPDWCFYQGTPDADIDAPEAWALSTGSPVRVAVIDSGIDYNHPDLATKYVGGYDFFNADPDPMDDHGHGTHVSGTIAAVMNNLTGTPADEEGVAGVAPNALLLAYKVCGIDGSCNDFAIQQAIARAAVDGARVINMSLGGPDFSQSTYDAVQDAWNTGLVIIAGAGNDGTTLPFYPAAFDNVVSVAAFDEDHRRASFSNYGSWVDISAPGNAIMSTSRMSACGTSTVPGDTGCYTWNSGTSMATPHVSGTAALIWSRPDVTTNIEVVDILLGSADPVGVSETRLDSWTIRGGLNLHDALSAGSTQPVAVAGSDQVLIDSDGNGTEMARLDGSASSHSNGTIVSYEWFAESTLIGTGATTTVALPVGTHTIVLRVTDDDDESDTDNVVITVAPANAVTAAATTPQANEAGPANGTFTISRSGNTSAALTVRYEVTGTALAGSDYLALPGMVRIDAGASMATVTVTPVDDAIYESSESVILAVVADPAYSLGSPSAATVTIVSNDLPTDLVISTMSAPATAGADTDIVVTDTTRNRGTGASLASATAFFLSANTTLDAGDVFLGSRPAPGLAAGATDVLSTTIHIGQSTSTGSYYVLATADADGAVAEDNETNNVKASGVVKIGPDLVVPTISVPASAAAGTAVSVYTTIKNQGGGFAAASSTGFYLSTNASIDDTDVFLGGRSVGELASGATSNGSVSLLIPADTAAGSYYIISRADWNRTLAETSESNNDRAFFALKIGGDLVVSALSVPLTAKASGSLTINDTTKNSGAETIAASETGFYLSVNTSWNPTDIFLGSRTVPSLGVSQTSAAATQIVIPADTAPGSYFVIAVANWNIAVAESTENNNMRIATVRVGPDLVVSALSAPSSAVAGASITVNSTTKNQGGDDAHASVTTFYLSTNFTLDANDVLLGTQTVSSLLAAASVAGSVPLQIPASTPPASYYLIAKADGDGRVGESLETNNTIWRSISISAAP